MLRGELLRLDWPAGGRVGERREGCGIARVRPSWEAALLYRLAVDMGMRQEGSKDSMLPCEPSHNCKRLH